MANNITIELLGQPAEFETLWFEVSNSAIGFEYAWKKVFVPNTAILVGHVQLGATIADTLQNLKDNYVAHHSIANVTYEIIGTKLHLIFSPVGTYEVTVISTPNEDIVFNSELLPDTPPITIPELVLNDLSIEIIDTYENELPLFIEFTQNSSPKLSFDSGDDLLKSFMTSKLTFNILVTDGVDAHFKHLYTGDEKRYLVKLTAIDEEENTQLLWQGYLLPDQYNEPYVGGAYFVEFTAIDMLANLKNRFLKPWYYHQKITLVEFIAICLKETGINQNFLVAPALVPNNPLYSFQDLNIELKQYISNDKYTDLYTILTDVLESNLLTIYNFKGYWNIVGFNNKRKTSITFEQYNLDGEQLQNVILNKRFIPLINSNGSVNMSVKSPFKTVKIDFNSKGRKNIFSENVVVIPNKEQYGTYFFQNGAYLQTITSLPIDLPSVHYLNNDFKDWIVNLSLTQPYYRRFKERFFSVNYYNLGTYVATESIALNNYFECPEKPSVKAGLDYKFEFDIEHSVTSSLSQSALTERLKNGYYDKTALFQIFLNDVEILSNRPAFASDSNLVYKMTIEPTAGTGYDVKFSISLDYKFEESGEIKFRLLVPILGDSSDNSTAKFLISNTLISKLQISVEEDYDVLQNVVAVRDINFTTLLDYSCKFTSTIDNSLENNIGLGRPISDVYFHLVSRTTNPGTFQDLHFFPPASILILTLKMWDVNDVVYTDLFSNGFNKTLFLTSGTDEKEFISIYGYKDITGYSRMGYLFDYEGRPNIPKKYTKNLDVETTDVLQYMKIMYADEDLSDREKWSIVGEMESFDNFNKTMAKILHNLYSGPTYVQETTALNLVFPDDLIKFYFDEVDRKFIPTRLELDLFEGKTRITQTEDVYQNVTDITYE